MRNNIQPALGWLELKDAAAKAGMGSVSERPTIVHAALDRLIAHGERERFVVIMTITPEMARAMLELNIGNRPLTRSKVNLHITRLKAGRFVLIHQGISFCRDGRLNDGQHRLTAVAESGVEAEFTVTFGAVREEFAVVDQMGARTAAHILSIAGEENATIRASVAGILLMLATGKYAGVQEVAAFALELDGRGAAFGESIRIAQLMRKVTNPTATGVAYHQIAAAGASAERLVEFWHGLPTGENLSGVRLRLREWLMTGELFTANNQWVTVKRAAAIIKAWNAWRARRKTAKFSWDHVTSLPEVTP